VTVARSRICTLCAFFSFFTVKKFTAKSAKNILRQSQNLLAGNFNSKSYPKDGSPLIF
jgi:hypothetical protein